MCDTYEPNRFASLVKCKCPRCQSGKMFIYPGYNLNKFTRMFDDCPVCGFHFEIEPGYFWGAMYVSYAITVAMMIGVGGAILLLSKGTADFWTYIIPIISSFLIASPYTYRYAIRKEEIIGII